MTYAILSDNAIVAYGPAAALWPDCSFPIDGPNAEFLAEQGAIQIRSDLPHDPESERLAPATPYLLDGEVFDRIAEPLPPPPVTPRWVAFGAAVMADPGVNQMLLAVLAGNMPGLLGGLYTGLSDAAKGDPKVFLGADDAPGAWTAARMAGFVSPELVAHVQSIAEQCDLPAEFIAALAV